MAREKREVWADRVRRWSESGLTAKEFATELGVNVHSLNHWKWRLTSEARDSGERAPSARPGFVEVVTPRVREERAPELFEVQLPRGVVVRVPQRFDGSALQRLLAALEVR
jgi:hypothetical protein